MSIAPKGILLTKLRYIGDVLLTTPAIRLIRQAYPEAHITMVVNKGTEDVLRYNPHLDRVLAIDYTFLKSVSFHKVLSYEWNFLQRLREFRYDLSVDFASGDRAAFMSLFSGVPCRIGFTSHEGFRRWIFNRQSEIFAPIHTVERSLLLLKQTLGLETDDKSLELYTGKEEEDYIMQLLQRHNLMGKRFVVIHPGAKFWFKRWPLERFAILTDILQKEMGLKVILTGGEQETEDIQFIISQMKTTGLSLAGRLTILQLAALYKRALLFIGNDSGPMHIAAASGTPVIALFGPTEPEIWGPWGGGHLTICKKVPCSPCSNRGCNLKPYNCMEQISVDEVLQGVYQCLDVRSMHQ